MVLFCGDACVWREILGVIKVLRPRWKLQALCKQATQSIRRVQMMCFWKACFCSTCFLRRCTDIYLLGQDCDCKQCGQAEFSMPADTSFWSMPNDRKQKGNGNLDRAKPFSRSAVKFPSSLMLLTESIKSLLSWGISGSLQLPNTSEVETFFATKASGKLDSCGVFSAKQIRRANCTANSVHADL